MSNLRSHISKAMPAPAWRLSQGFPVLVLAAILGACGPSGEKGALGGSSKSAAGCNVRPDTTPVWLAVREYIKTAQPTPQRFLSAAGTDSGLPDDGVRALQDKGPTFFYAGSDAARKKLLDKLAGDGPFTTLLIVMKDTSATPEGGRSITLDGHFVGGMQDGQPGGKHTYSLACDTTGWKLTGTQDVKAP